MLTENVTVIGPRRGAENIKSASAADGETLGLKNAAASGNLGLIEPSIWGISGKVLPERAGWLRTNEVRGLVRFGKVVRSGVAIFPARELANAD